MVWDKDKPAGNQKLRLADDDLRANNAALEAAIDEDHDFTTGGTQTGEHHKVTLQKQASDPGQEADKGKLYTKEVDSEIELFYRDKTEGHILQLTRGGNHALIPSGTKMLFYQDTAPPGWTIQDTLDDMMVFITKGKAAGGSPGGEPHLGSFAFDGGSNAGNLQENDTIRYTGGGSWSCRLRSIEYSGSAPNQTGRIYYDTLAGGTPANNDPIEDNNSRSFTADVNGLNRAAGSWTISGLGSTGAESAHTHSVVLPETGWSAGSSGSGGRMYAASDIRTAQRNIGSTAGSSHSHSGSSGDGEWRPKGYASIIAQKD